VDFYVVLGIERSATTEEIKRAYRRLARRFHPDINPGDRLAATQFRRIAEAYETLSDPARRKRYDTTGVPVELPPPGTFGFEGFDFSVTASGAGASTFGDLFADVLRTRQANRSAGPARGADLHQVLAISFEDAMHGGQWALTVTRQERCRACGGLGVVAAPEVLCAQCRGAGLVRQARGHMVFSKSCTRCGGRGFERQRPCGSCGGRQVETRVETLTIKVPPGLADGSRIRVPGKGHVDGSGGEPGDLYVTVQIAPHALFEREGDDLRIVVPVAVHEAALGAKIEIPAPDGEARLRVPPGTRSGQRFRIRGRGLPSPRDGSRGDLVAEVRIVLPRLLDERSKELLREFGRINGEDVRQELWSRCGRTGSS
jgi:molecular chaperone DnaJ